MLVKIYVGEKPVCQWKTFTNMQLLKRRDVGGKYVGEYVCCYSHQPTENSSPT